MLACTDYLTLGTIGNRYRRHPNGENLFCDQFYFLECKKKILYINDLAIFSPITLCRTRYWQEAWGFSIGLFKEAKQEVRKIWSLSKLEINYKQNLRLQGSSGLQSNVGVQLSLSDWNFNQVNWVRWLSRLDTVTPSEVFLIRYCNLCAVKLVLATPKKPTSKSNVHAACNKNSYAVPERAVWQYDWT